MRLSKRRLRPSQMMLTLAVLVVVIAGAVAMLTSTGQMTTNEQTEALEKALHNAVVSCYAIEGKYPANLQKVISDYGIVIDDSKYFVTYDIFASNIMPTITISLKGEK